MTAPRAELPRCPVCGGVPKAEERPYAAPEYRWLRLCVQSRCASFHYITTYGRTQAEADARWRRCAGEKK